MSRRKNRITITLDLSDVPVVLAALKNYRDCLNSFLEDSEGDDVQSAVDERDQSVALIARFASIPT